jgi:hypothetical protein
VTTPLPTSLSPWFADALAAVARTEPTGIDAYLHTIGVPMTASATKAVCRTHWVPLNPQGQPRVDALAKRLAEEVVAYCIPRRKIADAQSHFLKTGSPSRFSRLESEAKGLFTKLVKSGEGGELLLYFLMETYLGVPQILCKMDLKTNTNMHVHGVDGVHAQFLDNGNLAVYWGESKIYKDFSGAVSDCFGSIAPFLTDAGGSAVERDIHLVRDNIDAGNRDLSLALAKYFDNDYPQAQHLEVRGACLLGFSQEQYSSPFEADGISVRPELLKLINGWQASIAKRATDKKIETFHIEVFCLPLPSADSFRQELRSALGLS